MDPETGWFHQRLIRPCFSICRDGIPPYRYRKQHRKEMHESAKANGRVPLPHIPVSVTHLLSLPIPLKTSTLIRHQQGDSFCFRAGMSSLSCLCTFLYTAHVPHAKGHPRRASEVCSGAHQQAGDSSQREGGSGTTGRATQESTTGELAAGAWHSCVHSHSADGDVKVKQTVIKRVFHF